MNDEKVCPTCGSALRSAASGSQCPRCMIAAVLLPRDTMSNSEIDCDEEPIAEITSAGNRMSGVWEAPGRYETISEQGRGGMGHVLLVHDAFLGRDVALKELISDSEKQGANASIPVGSSVGILSRFLREARITGQLEHPSIVPVYEVGHRQDGTIYYTMRFVRGKTLRAAMASCQSLEERLTLLPHFVDLCQAIAYAHSRGVIHRDVKPENIMVGEFGETVVLDWGLAKERGHCENDDSHVGEAFRGLVGIRDDAVAETQYGQVIGTPAYMAPEQARGDLNAVDEKSDVYSLGVVLYEILSGRLPYEAKTASELLRQVIAGSPSRIDSYDKSIPRALGAIAARAMNVEKDKRFDTVIALAAEVQRFQAGALVETHRYTLADYTRFVWNRHRTLILMGAGTLLFVTSIVGVYTNRLAEKNRELAKTSEVAVAAQAEAEKAREQEVAERVHAEKASYIASIRLAQGHIERGEARLARTRLMEQPAAYRNWEWGYLYQSLDASLYTMDTAAWIYDAILSPYGDQLLTMASDGTGSIWDTTDGTRIFTVYLMAVPHLYGTFSPDGSRVTTIMADHSLQEWDVATGAQRQAYTGHSDRVLFVAYSPDGSMIASGSVGGTVNLWDTHPGQVLFSSQAHGDSVNKITFSPDGSRFVSVSNDHLAKVWDTRSGELLYTLSEHTDVVVDVAYAPDGKHFVTASYDSTARIWDSQSGALIRSLVGHAGRLQGAKYSPDGNSLLTFGNDDIAILWDVQSGVKLHTFVGHMGVVSDASFSPDGTLIVSAAWDGATRLWDAVSGTPVATLVGHEEAVARSVFNPKGDRILTASHDRTAKIWEVPSRDESARSSTPSMTILRGHNSGVIGASFSPEGDRIVTNSDDGTARVWGVDSEFPLLTLGGYSDPVYVANFSPDGKRIVTTSKGHGAAIWNSSTGEALFALDSPETELVGATFSPDGTRILTGSEDGQVMEWDGETGRALRANPIETTGEASVVYSPDGTRFVMMAIHGEAALWDAATGEKIFTLSGHPLGVLGASFSPDGSRIVSTGWEKNAIVCDARSGAYLFALEGHTAAVRSAEYSPDGTRIVTSSWDKLAKIWDGETGKELLSLRGHDAYLWTAKFSPDGSHIVTASNDGTARIWNTAPWNPDAWMDATDRALMIPLALRRSAKVSIGEKLQRDTPEFAAAVKTVEALRDRVANLKPDSAEKGIAWVGDRGLYLSDSATLAALGAQSAEDGDVILQINGQQCYSPARMVTLLEDFLSFLADYPTQSHHLRIDVVNRYEHKGYDIEYQGY